MKRWRTGFCIAFISACAVLPTAHAQETSIQNNIAPLPVEGPDTLQRRITPENADVNSQGIYTTRKQSPGGASAVEINQQAPLPWVKASPAAPLNAPANAYTGTKSPFGRGSSGGGPVIPSAPHDATAVPVVDVDAVEASTPEPATPVAPAADPVQEDPAQPTELTSPIFDANADSGAARKMTFRVLNKVTGQSALLEARPGERLKFGQIEVLAHMCRASSPTSQTDYAGLLEINEYLPGNAEVKKLFHGWMYASSPSITALEHPVYDVTMVECVVAAAAPVADAEAEKPAPKKPNKWRKKP